MMNCARLLVATCTANIPCDRNLFKTNIQNIDMEIQILEEKENPLLERKEIQLRVIQDAGSPKISDLRKKIAAQLSLDEPLFVVQHVIAEFGMNESRCMLKIYRTKERLKDVEAEHVLRKNGLMEVSDET
jgi:small subunit ribosomal protein S24e